MKKMRVYLSGPISGHDLKERRRAFKEIQERLEKLGIEVFNPMENGLPPESTTHQHMHRDIATLSNEDHPFDLIYMMIDMNNPAWKKTESLVYLFYKYSFEQSKKGYGATVVVVLLVVIMIITAIQLIGQKKWVHYE